MTTLLQAALALFVLNEIRGLIMAGPVLWAMLQGPTWMLAWTLFCIAASVFVPLVILAAIKTPMEEV